MADLLEQSSSWLEDQRERFMTRSIVYQRDLMTAAALEDRLRFNVDTILRLVAT